MIPILCIDRIRADSAVRVSAVVSVENTQNLIAEVVTALPLEEHVALKERRLRRTVHTAKMRARKLAGEEDGVYTSLQDLVLPSKMLERTEVCQFSSEIHMRSAQKREETKKNVAGREKRAKLSAVRRRAVLGRGRAVEEKKTKRLKKKKEGESTARLQGC